jgi:hypothetical protein
MIRMDNGRMFGDGVRIVREGDEPWADQNPVICSNKRLLVISVEGAQQTAFSSELSCCRGARERPKWGEGKTCSVKH